MARRWTPVRTLDLRIDVAARNSAMVIKARGLGAAEQFLRRLAAHLDEVSPSAPSADPDGPSPQRKRPPL